MAPTKQKLKEYHKKYYEKHRERCLATSKTWRTNNKERFLKLLSKWRKKNPEYYNLYKEDPKQLLRAKSRTKLNNAIIQGKIKRLPCEVCGTDKTEGHHTDYSRPFDVKWLCKNHHEELHKKFTKSND